jgi:hypothetical protein
LRLYQELVFLQNGSWDINRARRLSQAWNGTQLFRTHFLSTDNSATDYSTKNFQSCPMRSKGRRLFRYKNPAWVIIYAGNLQPHKTMQQNE